MLIEFSSTTVRFAERTVVDDVSLSFSEHRIGLIGANGSGKSTLARLINGLVTPTTGRVLVDGQDVARRASTIRARVGFVFTNPDSQIVMPTVREDVAFSLRRSGLSRTEQTARVEHALAQFDLEALAEQPAHRLSGGQKQLLALAAIVVTEPELIIADEPTTLLDARHARLVADRFAALPQQLIVATHQLDTLHGFDRVIVLDEGRVIADDTPRAAIAVYERLLAR